MGQFLSFVGFVVGGSALASLAMGGILFAIKSHQAKNRDRHKALHS